MKYIVLLLFFPLVTIGMQPIAPDNIDQALIDATKDGDIAHMERLIGLGARVNHLSHQQGTPLMIASFNGDLPAVQLLLQRGADPNKEAANGAVPLSSLLVATFAQGTLKTRQAMPIARELWLAGADFDKPAIQKVIRKHPIAHEMLEESKRRMRRYKIR